VSEIIDCVIVSTEPYTEPGRSNRSAEECRQYCEDVHTFVFRLTDLGFRDDDMPRPLLHVYRVTELVYRSEPVDDVLDFLIEIKWSKTLVEETINALEEIGADAHARFLTDVHQYLQSREYKPPTRKNVDEICEVIEKATEDQLSADILQQRYGNFGVDGDSDWERRLYSICLHAVNYMDGWTNIKRVPGGAHNDAELEKYFASRPEIVRRLKEIEKENARPD
jgi:hypothetical protein